MKRLIALTTLIVAGAVCYAVLSQFISHPIQALADEPPQGMVLAERASVAPTSIPSELRELREDVKILRRDVSRLIEILEVRDDEAPVLSVPPEDPQSATDADAVQDASPEFNTTWRVTLDEVISIAVQNSKAIRNLGGTTAFSLEDDTRFILARPTKDTNVSDLTIAIRNLVSDVEEVYWNLWAAHRNLETVKAARDSAQKLWNESYEIKLQDDTNAQAETETREQYFFFRSQLESALKNLHNREEQLRYLIGLAKIDGNLMRPAEEPAASEVKFDWNKARTNALTNSRELSQQRWAVKQRELQLRTARNALSGQLPEGYVRTVDGAFRELELPLGVRRQLSGVRNAQLNLAREKARLADMEVNLSHQFAKAFRQLDFARAMMQAAANRRTASNSEIKSIRVLYSSGKTTIDLLLDAYRRQSQDNLNYNAAVASYAIAVKDVHFRKGSLLAERNITLIEPGMSASPLEDARAAPSEEPVTAIPPG